MSRLLLIAFFMLAIIGQAAANDGTFFTQQDLADQFEHQLDLSHPGHSRFQVGDLAYADRNQDGEYVLYRIKAIMPNGDLLATEVGFDKTVRFSPYEFGTTSGRFVGRTVFADQNADNEYVQYVIVGRFHNKLLAKEVGFSKVSALNLRDVAFQTIQSGPVYQDRNADGNYAQYTIHGIFGNGDVIVKELGFSTYYRAQISEIAFSNHWLVGERTYGDWNRDGEYAEYIIRAILPVGNVIAQEVGHSNFRAFTPTDLGYTSAQTAYDVYRMLCDHIQLQ